MAIGTIESKASQVNQIRKASPFDEQINRAQMIHERLLTISSRLQATADRLLGEEPEACGTCPQDAPAYSGAMFRLRDVLADINAAIDRLESKTNRLADAI